MENRADNGGFPEPPSGEPVRVVRTAHRACGGETRIRLPRELAAVAVRRVVCERCEHVYRCTTVDEIAADRGPAAPQPEAQPPPPRLKLPSVRLPRPRRPSLPSPDSRIWRWAGIPVAAIAVVAILIALQGDGGEAPISTGASPASQPPASFGKAKLLVQPGFSLALPPGWKQTDTRGGAAFAAVDSDGSADATLWIERAPSLSFADFEARSVAQLRSLAGTAEVIERVPAPTPEGTVVRLRADAPESSGVSAPYDVTLRAAGPYRYYLATTVQPDASRGARDGAELVHGSFVPEPDGRGSVKTASAPGGESAAGGAKRNTGGRR